MRAACIGSRGLTSEQLTICEKLGGWLVQCGWVLDTGNAPGADQAFARGANRFRPDLVHLHLPWRNFEVHAIRPGNVTHVMDELPAYQFSMYEWIARMHHPAWGRLSQGAQKLMIRNSSIMIPNVIAKGSGREGVLVDLCLAYPSDKPGGGGTGQGMRIAQHTTIRLVDLRDYTEPRLYQLCEEIAGWKA